MKKSFISQGLPFFRGNMHMHTTASDGALSRVEALKLYRDNGYDFVALTDHWKPGEESYYENMLVLSGVELDRDLDGQVAHIVGVGIEPEKLRVRRGMQPQEMIDAICAASGRAILAHPAWSLNTPEFICSLRNLSAVEVFNTFSGEPWNSERADSSNVLDLCACAGRLVPFVASDDSHRYEGEACRAYTMVQARALDRASILQALDVGAFYASQGPGFFQIELDGDALIVRTSPVERITFYSNLPWVHGRCRNGHDLTESVYTIARDKGESYVRCVLTDRFGRRAWSNPIDLTQA